jgi:hypothetical protein
MRIDNPFLLKESALMALSPRPAQSPPSPLVAIEKRLEEVSARQRRTRLSIIACLCSAAALGAWGLHFLAMSHQFSQGAREADAAISDTRRAMSFWTPERGYAPLMNKSFAGQSEWGSSQRIEMLAQGAGISIDYAFASQAQCKGLVSSADTFFDAIMVDGMPAKTIGSTAELSACTNMGQNAIRLAKIDRRSEASALSAGAMDVERGGLIPQAAQPAPAPIPSSAP